MLSYKNAAESFQGQDKSGDYCIFSPFFVFWKKPKGEKYMNTEELNFNKISISTLQL